MGKLTIKSPIKHFTLKQINITPTRFLSIKCELSTPSTHLGTQTDLLCNVTALIRDKQKIILLKFDFNKFKQSFLN